MKTFPKTTYLAAIFLTVFLASCMKNEFLIHFDFPKDYMGNYIASYYAWNSKEGTWVEHTIPIQQGKAEMKCITHRPTIVYLRDASSGNSIAVYAERGDEIVITGENSDMNKWTVSGNKTSEMWSEWRNKNADILSKGRSEFTKEKEKAISDFVDANKSEILSTLILLTEWNRRANPDGFLKIWNSIEEDAKDPRLLELCGCTDLLGVEFTVDAKGKLVRSKAKLLSDMVLRSRDNGIDTLRPHKVKSSLLYFFAEANSDRNEVIDSLRVIADEFPDSAKRIISVVSLHPDSMAWINAVRRDTVKAVVNAWMPRGVADSLAVSIGVARTPWFVVIGKGGKESYSGDDLKETLAAFRKDMKRKDSAPKSSPKKENASTSKTNDKK